MQNRIQFCKILQVLLEELREQEGEQKEENIEKYLPWSDELPEEIRNFEEEYIETEVF